MSDLVLHPQIEALLARSHRLGADKRITNFAGGNTSAKVDLVDPVTGDLVRVLVVKGSGGDLGTLTADGLALLVLDRVRALEAVHAGGVHEDDIVDRYRSCAFGAGGAVPSIDTPLHAFVDADHIDHLHPDAVIALATAADGERLTAECFGGDVAWLDWKRPGLELGLALRDLRRDRPDAIGAVLGGHGVIAWGDSSDTCEARSLELVERAEAFLAARSVDTAFGGPRPDRVVLDDEQRRALQAGLGPVLRGLASTDRVVVGHLADDGAVLELVDSVDGQRLAAMGTSCPDHFLRTKVRPLWVDHRPGDALADLVARATAAHAAYRAAYSAYYDRFAEPASPPRRGADPAIVLVPGLGMWSFAPDVATARIAGEFYRNAINVMRGAEALSAYDPIDDAERFRVEYWELEERKLRARPAPPRLQGRVALVTGGGSGIGRAVALRLAAEGAVVAVADLDAGAAEKTADAIGGESALALALDVADEGGVAAAFAAVSRRYGGVDLVVNNAGFATSAPLEQTTVEDFDRLHAVLSRGSFLVSREAARVMRTQGAGGDIVYIVSKNAVAAGPSNIAYGAAKADQAHQVRLLAAELGPMGVRVNGVNPDGVVRGSAIFSGEWLTQRAEAHGVAPEDLGSFYAGRTLLGTEVLPEHVAAAVFTLVGGDLSRTTGLLIPVDGGLAAGFLR